MALIQNTLFGKVDKVEVSLLRLREFEPKEGYYLAFSGGKDSCVIKTLADMAGVKYDAHYNAVGIDPPDLVYFIREHHPDVIFNRPKMTFFKMLIKKKFPPLRHMRWCCELLKEGGGIGRIVMTGIRWEESNSRRKRRLYEVCQKNKIKRYLHPVIDWTKAEVWEFLRGNNIPTCKLYAEGWDRIGCLFCPMQSAWKRRRDIERYPRFANAFRRAFKRLWDYRVANGLPHDNWKNSDEWFDWWIADTAPKIPEGQTCFAFDN